MGYKKTHPVCYLVSWPDGVIKAGYSEQQRWRPFVLRGGQLDAYYVFGTSAEAFDLETHLYDHMRAECPPAFTAAAAASNHLGTAGGGWRECFLTSNPSNAIASCIRIADAYVNGIARENATDGRTDGLTKKHSPQVDISPNASRAICIEFASSGPSGCTREATG